MRKTFWYLLQVTRRLWVRTALFAALSVVLAALVAPLSPLVPESWTARFGDAAAMPLLDILSSSMLAVVTFSLGVMVSTHRRAAGQMTPRAHRVLLEDTTTHRVLATFTGAFVYALCTIILLRSGFHDEGSAVIVFFVTVAVIVLVVVAILRWIDHLSDLGSMDHVLGLIARRTAEELARYRGDPLLGCAALDAEGRQAGRAWAAPASGTVAFIDLDALGAAAEAAGAGIDILVLPGDQVLRGDALARVTGGAGSEKLVEALEAGFTLREVRDFALDPRFGLTVLSETAQRALSPGINDPGTAIDVIGRLEAVLWEHATTPAARDAPVRARLRLPRIPAEALLRAAFQGTARDGAATIEVAARLQRALGRLSGAPDAEIAAAARRISAEARDMADAALTQDFEREQLARACAGRGEGVAPASPR